MALQDHEENPRRKAARTLSIVLLVVLAGCASGPRESPQARRMRLYRQYYKHLTPAQRQEYLSGRFDSAESAERRLKSYAEANRSEASLVGARDSKTAALEQVWRRAEKFLADAEKRAAEPQQKMLLESELSELAAALKQNEGTIRHTPYDSVEQAALLQRNAYYASRLRAMKNMISKSKKP